MTDGEYQKLREKVGGELTYTMDLISHERRLCEQDLYVLTGQPQSLTTDPIDSWTLFCWMQEQHIPSRYLIHKKSSFYQKILEEKRLQDVITLDDEDFQLGALLRREDLWLRAKAFIAEWGIDVLVDEWMRRQPGLRYVFLQHGITGTCFTAVHAYPFREVFNDANTSSERERILVSGGDEDVYKRTFLAGFPRYDLFNRSTSDDTSPQRTVLVMLTWRMGLSQNEKKLRRSSYWNGIQALLSPENIQRLEREHIRVLFAPHHSMYEHLQNWPITSGVNVIPQDKISYWIRHAQALITDFSSVSFDFLFQHKPVIYWIPDEEIRNEKDANAQDREKIASALSLQQNFFNIVKSPQEAVAMLLDYAGRDFVLEREKCNIAESYFAYESDFCRHVYDAVEERCCQENLALESMRQHAPFDSPKISIIVPVYNAGLYLQQCFDSLIRQTIEDIEVVAVNDGSVDTSPDIMEEYARKDGRLRIIHQRNQGTFFARQVGFRASRGRYVLFVDPDDWIEPDTCEKLLSGIEKTGDDILFFGVTCENEGNINEEAFRSICESSAVLPAASLTSREDMLRACYIDRTFSWMVWGRLFSHSLLERAFAEMPHLRCVYAEDMLSTFYFLSFCSSMSSIDVALYHYRVGVGISTRECITNEHFYAVLRSYELFFHVRRFADNHYGDSPIVHDVLTRIENMLSEGVMMMAYRTTEFANLRKHQETQNGEIDALRERVQRLQTKRERYLRILRSLIVLSALLSLCVALATLRIFGYSF